jgi:hypothetical protein
MDPLTTNRLDPALRVTAKPGDEYEPPPRRRRRPAPAKPDAEEDTGEPNLHQLDDLA